MLMVIQKSPTASVTEFTLLFIALLFSATFRKKIEKLARDILIDPIRVVQGDIGEVIPISRTRWDPSGLFLQLWSK